MWKYYFKGPVKEDDRREEGGRGGGGNATGKKGVLAIERGHKSWGERTLSQRVSLSPTRRWGLLIILFDSMKKKRRGKRGGNTSKY